MQAEADPEGVSGRKSNFLEVLGAEPRQILVGRGPEPVGL